MSGLPHISEDLSELIAALNSHMVEFLIVGAHALAQYVQPRYTSDLDLFLDRSPDNIERLSEALRDFGLPVDEEAMKGMTSERRVMIIIGHEPNRVDFLNFLTGLEFKDAYAAREYREIGGILAPHLSKSDLIKSKRATGRPQDLLDAESLIQSCTRDQAE